MVWGSRSIIHLNVNVQHLTDHLQFIHMIAINRMTMIRAKSFQENIMIKRKFCENMWPFFGCQAFSLFGKGNKFTWNYRHLITFCAFFCSSATQTSNCRSSGFSLKINMTPTTRIKIQSWIQCNLFQVLLKVITCVRIVC